MIDETVLIGKWVNFLRICETSTDAAIALARWVEEQAAPVRKLDPQFAEFQALLRRAYGDSFQFTLDADGGGSFGEFNSSIMDGNFQNIEHANKLLREMIEYRVGASDDQDNLHLR